MPTSTTDRILALGLLIAGGLHAFRYVPHVSDDAFISFRYAERLASGHGLTFNTDDPVEGYSNLLWVILQACGVAAGVPPMWTARALGLLGFALCIACVAPGRTPRVRALSGGLSMALCGGLAAWAVGGLEHTWFAALVLVWVVAIRRGVAWGDALAAPIVWLRLDAMVLVAAVVLVFRRPRAAAVGGAALLAHMALRWGVHGDLVPNTVRAKVSGSPERAWQGATWVVEALLHNGVLVVAAVCAALVCRDAWKPLAVAGIWCGYVAFVGGDSFYGYRQLVPVLPLMALAFADGAEARSFRWGPVVAGVYGASHLTLVPVRTLAQPGWALAGRDAGRVLREAFADQDPLLATDAAGVLPYTTRFQTVDLLGLNDRWLATHPPSDWGGGDRLAHDLGNGAYAASRKPDLVAFCHALGAHEACFRSGREWMTLDDWDQYVPLFVRTEAGTGRYFVRRDGRLGRIHRGGVEFEPAALLTSEQHPGEIKEGRLQVEITPGRWVAEREVSR